MKKKIIIIIVLIVLTITLVAIPKSTYQKLFGNKIDEPVEKIYTNHQIVYVMNPEQKLVGLKVGVEEIEEDQIVQKWDLLTKESTNLPTGYKSPINIDTKMIDYQINNEILTFNLSEEFLESNGKFAISSLAWTFCDEDIKEIVVLINDNIISKLDDYEFTRINKEVCVNYEFESMFVYQTTTTTIIHHYDDYLIPVTYFHEDSDQCNFMIEKIISTNLLTEDYDYTLEKESLVVNLGISELLTKNELNSLVDSIKYNLSVSNIIINGIETVIYKSEAVDEL